MRVVQEQRVCLCDGRPPRHCFAHRPSQPIPPRRPHAAAAFAFFTFCNIGPRGAQHHRWYLSKFEDYPKDRRAVIPYIW